jgi:hypothetical protein
MPRIRPIEAATVLASVKAKALRVAAPALTAAARGGRASCGRDGRMLAARVELKNRISKKRKGI